MYSLEIKKQAKKYLEKMPIAYRDRMFLAF